MKNNFQIMKLNVEANMLRIQQLLKAEGIENQFQPEGWYVVNRENAELRQRLHMLRKDVIALQKILKG